jgi:tetratricopeptide (TPR) repeat protein
MLEFIVVLAVAGYIYYLKNYADLRSGAEKEADLLAPGIQLYKSGKIGKAFDYFSDRIATNHKSPVAYLYRARCYMANGDRETAAADLAKGLAYDDSVFELHLDLGKIRFETGHYSLALTCLNQAISKSSGKNAESYHWRAQTHIQMGHPDQAADDFFQENRIQDDNQKASSTEDKGSQKVVDRKLLANLLLTVFTTALLLWVIKNAAGIHLPYLLTVAASVSLGFVEPHRGWVLAVFQVALLWLGYIFLTAQPQNSGQSEFESFSSMVLTFAGSFLGAFLKRALNG